ncbi:putative transcription factor TIFY family [Helianthus anomalus]
MSESSTIEIDFFSKKASDRRDIQGMISKINPELLKTAIASASANSFVANTAFSSSLQLQTPCNQDCGVVNMPVTVAPMTIFYNGTVSVFDVTSNQAESILKLAESVNSVSKNVVESTRVISNDLPMSRKRSLRMFLEKRKERHEAMSPYACSQGSTS